MKRTQALVVALASLTLCSSIPQEAREPVARSGERPAEPGAGSSDPQAIGCPPKGFVWILLALAPIMLAAIPVYVVVKVVSWFFKRKPKPSRPKTESAPPCKLEWGPPAPEHMTRLQDFGMCAA